MLKQLKNNFQTTLKNVKISPKNTPHPPPPPPNKGDGSLGGKNPKTNYAPPPPNKGHGSQGGKNQKPINQGKESHSNQGDPKWRENSPLGNKSIMIYKKKQTQVLRSTDTVSSSACIPQNYFSSFQKYLGALKKICRLINNLNDQNFRVWSLRRVLGLFFKLTYFSWFLAYLDNRIFII